MPIRQPTLFDPFGVEPALIQLLTPDEIYEQAERFVGLLKEDRRIERKTGGIHSQSLGEYFSMWANTSPDGGLIVVGIEDDGSVSGLKTLDHKPLNTLEKCGYDRCPQAFYDTKRVRIKNEKKEDDFVLLIRVKYHQTRVVETCDGKVFVRRGDSRIEIKKEEERRQMRLDKGELQHEQEPVTLPYPDEFEMPLIIKWAAKVRKDRSIPEEVKDE